MTRIAIVGAGRIGGNLARLYASAGHDVTVSFARDKDQLAALAARVGATTGDPAPAAAQAEVVVISVPWAVVDTAIEQAGGPGALAGKLVIDTTNQFGRTGGGFGVLDLGESSAAAVNAAKAPQAIWVKAFNTLTAGFQASSAGRTGPDQVVVFYATDHNDAVPRPSGSSRRRVRPGPNRHARPHRSRAPGAQGGPVRRGVPPRGRGRRRSQAPRDTPLRPRPPVAARTYRAQPRAGSTAATSPAVPVRRHAAARANLRHSGTVRTRPYSMDVPFMLVQRHERGIYAL